MVPWGRAHRLGRVGHDHPDGRRGRSPSRRTAAVPLNPCGSRICLFSRDSPSDGSSLHEGTHRASYANDHYALDLVAFAAGAGQSVRLDDNTGEAFSDRLRLAFDALRVTPMGPGPIDAGTPRDVAPVVDVGRPRDATVVEG
jgi:hypothetical protein